LKDKRSFLRIYATVINFSAVLIQQLDKRIFKGDLWIIHLGWRRVADE
jgi:hypothetical protein